MFKRGDRVKTIVHNEGFKRIDLKGEVLETFHGHKGMDKEFLRVMFKLPNGNYKDGVFFSEAWELDNGHQG